MPSANTSLTMAMPSFRSLNTYLAQPLGIVTTRSVNQLPGILTQISFIDLFSNKSRQPYDEMADTDGGRTYNEAMIYRLLRTEEKNYLMIYWLDYFQHLRKSEQHSMLEGILDKHPNISKFLRAHLIEWLANACNQLDKEDNTLLFTAVNIMDRFYKHTLKPQPSEEVQLTGLTGLFITSKYFEIMPIHMEQLINQMCYQKYNQTQFLDRETEIITLLTSEIDQPTHFDFVLMYFKMLRLYLQVLKGPLSKNCLNYYLNSENIACDYCKMMLADVALMSVRPSILGATAVLFGLKTGFHQLEAEFLKKSNQKHQKIFIDPLLISEIQFINHSWREISLTLLKEISDFSQIEAFMKEVSERASCISHKWGKKLNTLF